MPICCCCFRFDVPREPRQARESLAVMHICKDSDQACITSTTGEGDKIPGKGGGSPTLPKQCVFAPYACLCTVWSKASPAWRKRRPSFLAGETKFQPLGCGDKPQPRDSVRKRGGGCGRWCAAQNAGVQAAWGCLERDTHVR